MKGLVAGCCAAVAIVAAACATGAHNVRSMPNGKYAIAARIPGPQVNGQTLSGRDLRGTATLRDDGATVDVLECSSRAMRNDVTNGETTYFFDCGLDLTLLARRSPIYGWGMSFTTKRSTKRVTQGCGAWVTDAKGQRTCTTPMADTTESFATVNGTVELTPISG